MNWNFFIYKYFSRQNFKRLFTCYYAKSTKLFLTIIFKPFIILT